MPRTADLDPLCLRLRSLREAAGLSQRELARRMGVGVSSVSSIEAGRLPRRSTLRKLFLHLPGLELHDVFPSRQSCPLASPDSVWSAAWDAATLRAERVEVTSAKERTTISVIGVRSWLADGSAAVVAAMQAICTGSAGFVRGLSLAAIGTELTDGSSVHRFHLRGKVIDYRCEKPDGDGPSFAIAYPVRCLVLSTRRPTARAIPHVSVYPQATGERAGRDLARHLFPHGLGFRGHGGMIRVQVPRPLVGLRYILVFGNVNHVDDAATSRSRGRQAKPLERERVAAALSTRALARRAGLTHPTIAQAEAGADSRVSTIRLLLAALPRAQASEIMGSIGIGASDVWEFYRLFFGFAAARVTKTIDIARDGSRTMHISTRELVPVSEAEDEIVLRLGRERAVLEEGTRSLTHVSDPRGRMQVLHLARQDGTDVHQIRLRGRRSGGGVTFSRFYHDSGRYTLHAAPTAGSEVQPSRAGSALPVQYPQREARLVVLFPAGYEPLDVRGHAWPSRVVPDESIMLFRGLPNLPVRFSRRAGRLTAHLVVQRPSVGYHYSMSWQKPAAT